MMSAAGWRRLGALVILCALTLALFDSKLRYRTVASQLVPSAFVGNWMGGGEAIAVPPRDPSVALLSANSAQTGQFPYLSTGVPLRRDFTHVRVVAELRGDKLQPGPGWWQRGRIVVDSFDASRRKLRHLPQDVASLDGDGDWQRASLEVPIAAEVAGMQLTIYNAGRSGTLAVRNLAVDGVVETGLFRVTRWAMMALWVAVGLWCLWPLARLRRRGPASIGAVAMGAVILAGTLAPQPFLSSLSSPVFRAVERSVVGPVLALWRGDAQRPQSGASAGAEPGGQESPAGAPAELRPPVDRATAATARPAPAHPPPQPAVPKLDSGVLSHLMAFVVLGAIAALGFAGVRPVLLLAWLLMFSAATESLQSFQDTRTPEIMDLAMNGLGVVIGLAVGIALGWAQGGARSRGIG